MEIFKVAAKVTHPIYGSNSHPAVVDNLKNFRMVSNIATHRITITTIPERGDWNPKNVTDHKAFRASCTRNMTRAILTRRLAMPRRQMMKADIPISK